MSSLFGWFGGGGGATSETATAATATADGAEAVEQPESGSDSDGDDASGSDSGDSSEQTPAAAAVAADASTATAAGGVEPSAGNAAAADAATAAAPAAAGAAKENGGGKHKHKHHRHHRRHHHHHRTPKESKEPAAAGAAATTTTTTTSRGGEEAVLAQDEAPLSEEQSEALAELRRRVVQDADAPLDADQRWFCTDACLARYLRARKWDVDAAETMLRGTLEWRGSFRPHGITASEMASQIAHGHMYSRLRDRHGRPVVWLRVHQSEDPHTSQQRLQFMLYIMEHAIRTMDARRGVEKMVWVCSCQGYSLKYNGDATFARSLLQVLQAHYPERLGMLVLYDAPFMFRLMWKVVYPFIDDKTKSKIRFLSSTAEVDAFLEEAFDADARDQVERTYGGPSDFVYDAAVYQAECERVQQQEAAAVAAAASKSG